MTAKLRVKTGLRLIMVLATVALAACGVPTDPKVRKNAVGNVPFSLLATSTTSTTRVTTTIAVTPSTLTTLVPVTTLSPPSTVPVVTDPVTEMVFLYFVVGDRFVKEARFLPVGASPEVVIASLVLGPSRNDGLVFARSAVGFGDVTTVSVDRGLATIALDSSIQDFPPSERRRVVGQLVLTLTSQRGIGQVLFTVDGQALDVPRGDGTFDSGPLSFADFSDLIEEIPPSLNSPFTTEAPSSVVSPAGGL